VSLTLVVCLTVFVVWMFRQTASNSTLGPRMAALQVNAGLSVLIPAPGEVFDIRVTVNNTGKGAEEDLRLDCEIPPGLKLIGSSPKFSSPGTFSWGKLRPNESFSVTLKLKAVSRGQYKIQFNAHGRSRSEPHNTYVNVQ